MKPVAVPALGQLSKTREGAVELYDNWAATYDDALRSWDYPAPARCAELLRQYAARSALPVFDAGCGTGLSGEALRAEGFPQIIGSDVSSVSVMLAAEKGIYEDVCVVDLECEKGPLPFESGAFSGVVSVGVFSYVHGFEKLFPELCRVVSPGGVVVFTHRAPLWDDDVDAIRTVAEALEHEQGLWKRLYVSEPQPYMPRNPDPNESKKKIQYIVHRVL